MMKMRIAAVLAAVMIGTAAVFTDCLCVNREDLDLMAALRTDLIHDTNLRFALTSFHDHSDCLLN